MAEILSKLKRAADYVKSLGYFPVYISLYGSQNYELSFDGIGHISDYDYKCIVLPSLQEITEEKEAASLTVDFEGGQIDIKDIRLFTRLIEKMNPAYLEGLLTENYLVLSGGEQVESMRELLPALFEERGADFARVCAKLFEEKEKRLCHASPAQAENIARYGYDLKQAHHMYRLLVTLRVFGQTGEMQLVPPDEEKELLLNLKCGKYNLDEVLRMTETWREEIHLIETRLAVAYGKEKKTALKQLEILRKAAVYEHCRREALDDGESAI